MKTAIVPAQITTVEDKVAGNLSLAQLLLLATPIFGSCAIYIVLPPNLEFSVLKVGAMALVTVLFWISAIRLKGQLLLLWIIILCRYNVRPRYHVYDKNDLYLRPVPKDVTLPKQTQQTTPEKVQHTPEPDLDILDIVKLRQIITNPDANLHFSTDRKGGLRVNITEVK